ncbi:hypothetical protein GGF32_000747 [Allomyces javanicus]|nr:hypothetical protein GGF32_000747 [Allomyces javanicus]
MASNSRPPSSVSAVSAAGSAALAGPVPDASQTPELAVFVDALLKQMQSKFEDMSGQILTKLDGMSSRLDDLEKSISDLMENAAAPVNGDSTSAPPASDPAAPSAS